LLCSSPLRSWFNSAWAPFFDTPLQDDADFEINVDNSTGGATAMTITYLNGKGTKIKTMQIISVPPGQTVQYLRTIPKNTSRVFLDVEPLAGNTLGIGVKQGAINFSQSVNGDTRITFDAVPAP
jgi:hypothetical protein